MFYCCFDQPNAGLETPVGLITTEPCVLTATAVHLVYADGFCALGG